MAVAVEDFTIWLDLKLKELNTDETVFGSYICGILDSDESPEEKSEALQGILSEILENNDIDIEKISTEILEKWQSFKTKEPPPAECTSEELNVKLAKLLESQSLATTKQKQYTEEEKKIREAILSQYSQMTDSEDDEDNEKAAGEPKEKQNGLEKNLNLHTVAEAEKAKREQARLDSQKKKEKDKEDREKQKQLKEEKKEKRKTVKGERKR